MSLLRRLLPFYGGGDIKSDAVVIDTCNRLPPHTLELVGSDGTTLLLFTCMFGAYDVLPILLSKGANVDARNKGGATALHFTCFTDTFSPDSAMTLLRHGATAEVLEDEYGCSPLHWAGWAGHMELCKVLCIAGANPTTRDKNGNDPVDYANMGGHPECAKLLESFRSENGKDLTNDPKWLRHIDGNTGSSFYVNSDTGESLWGDDFRMAKEAEPDMEIVSSSVTTGVASESMDAQHVTTRSAGFAANDAVVSSLDEEFKATGVSGFNQLNNEESKLSSPNRRISIEVQSPLADILEVESSSSAGADDVVSMNEEPKFDHEEKIEGGYLEEKSRKFSSNPWGDEEVQEVKHHPKNDVAAHDKRNTSASFEDRISQLHSKMEAQLMDKLQHLENKISQQKEAPVKCDVDTARLQQNLAETSTTILHLKTEIGTRDLEILSLKQQIVRLETSLEKMQSKPTADVGVGNEDVGVDVISEEILAERVKQEQELLNSRDQINQLQTELKRVNASLSNTEKRCEETKHLLATAEQTVLDEKSSRSSMMQVLEQAQNGQRVDSSLTQSLRDENDRAQESISQLKEQLSIMQSNVSNETDGLREEIELLNTNILLEQKRVSKLENKLNQSIVSYEKALADSKIRHAKDVERVKGELNNIHKDELKRVKEQLKEEQLTRMEHEVSKNEAVLAMERATEKAASSERKLQEMMNFIKEAESLKVSNDKLHLSLQEETEKRKILHNTLEDMKVSGAVRCSCIAFRVLYIL